MKKAEREAARVAGLNFYENGIPCPRGHLGPRYVKTGMCRRCNIEQAASWKRRNPEKFLASIKASAKRNAERIRAYQRENSHKHKLAKWKRLGYPEPTRPLPATCELCCKPPTSKGLCLDHCHISGRFRGWLCQPCNTAIGVLGDSEVGLLAAISYLRRSEQ